MVLTTVGVVLGASLFAVAGPAASAEIATGAGITFSGTPFGTADWDGDGHADIIARNDDTADLVLYPGPGTRGSVTASPVVIGSGWNGFTPFGVADFNGDGHMDVIARQDFEWGGAALGSLWMYPGSGGRGPLNQNARTPILSGWNGFTPFGVADWDGDGHMDIIARQDYVGNGTTANGLWMYRGDGVTVGVRTLLLDGWNGFTPFGVADFNKDGHPDVIARQDYVGNGTTADGLWMYAGNGVTAGARVQLGVGWNGFTSVSVADWDGDGNMDVTARQDFAWSGTLAGSLWMYPGTGTVLNQNARVQLLGPAVTVPPLLSYPLGSDVVITHHDDRGEQSLIPVDLTLRAGESRRLIGSVNATMTTTTQTDMDDTVTLRCLDAAGVQAGIAATAESGIVPGETKVLRPTVLFTAPSAGVYHCYLAAETGSTTGPSMIVHTDSTFLQVSAGDEVGAQMWQNPPCDSAGTLTTCTYLGEPGGPTQKLLLFDDGTIPSLFVAADNVTTIDAMANVELTECGQTASCGGTENNGDSGTVSSHLEVVQLGASGTSTCHLTSSAERTDVIGKYVHHYNIAYSMPSVPVLTTCGGSRKFRVRVAMRWVSGNSVKIDGSREDPLAQTNAVAVNSIYASSTATVPSVFGLSQAAAQSALLAANLTLGSVTGVVSSAPPGTVIGQNAPAGTIESAGSPVNITVAQAPIVVPNVTSLPLSQAVSALEAVGLGNPTQHTQVDANCNEPIGTVTGQNPTAGTLEPAGFSVTLQIEAWPTQGCSNN